MREHGPELKYVVKRTLTKTKINYLVLVYFNSGFTTEIRCYQIIKAYNLISFGRFNIR